MSNNHFVLIPFFCLQRSFDRGGLGLVLHSLDFHWLAFPPFEYSSYLINEGAWLKSLTQVFYLLKLVYTRVMAIVVSF